MSTRSGLTRFTNPYFSYEFKNYSDFEYNNLARYFENYRTEYIIVHNYYFFCIILHRSIDEVFYRRAVDYYNVDSKAFIYSISLDSILNNELIVTSSHAIFVGNGKMSTPG